MTTDDPRDPPPPAPGTGGDSGASGGSGGPADLDELVSALLDGDLRGDAAVAARRRPDVAARLARVVAAREALGEVPPAPPAVREAGIAAALAAYDAGEGPSGERRAPADVRGTPAAWSPPPPPGRRGTAGAGDDLGARRVPPPVARRGLRWLGAAAAAAIVVAVVGLAVVRSDRDDATTASSDADVGQDDAGSAAEAPPAGTDPAPDDDGAAATRGEELAAVTDLGSFASVDALLDAASATDRRSPAPSADVDESESGADRSATASTALAARCPAGAPAPIADAGPAAVLVGRGTVDGAPVEVWTGVTSGEPVLVALDASCDVLSSRPVG